MQDAVALYQGSQRAATPRRVVPGHRPACWFWPLAVGCGDAAGRQIGYPGSACCRVDRAGKPSDLRMILQEGLGLFETRACEVTTEMPAKEAQ